MIALLGAKRKRKWKEKMERENKKAALQQLNR